MAPKKKFSKEEIVEAAFEIARTEGIAQITIRKVAQNLGSSIAPIYVNFADIEELKRAVFAQIHELSNQMLMTQYHPNPFLNIGIASLKFAREYNVLFRELVISDNSAYISEVKQDSGLFLEQMRRDPELAGFTDEELSAIFLKMQVFQLGLSVMEMNGQLSEQFGEEKQIALMESVGQDVIAAARMRKNGKP